MRLPVASSQGHAEVAAALRVGGGCRVKRTNHPYSPTSYAEPDADAVPQIARGRRERPAMRKVFASGVDYWRRTLHARHSWAMRAAIHTLGAGAPPPGQQPRRPRFGASGAGHHRRHVARVRPHVACGLPHLPDEVSGLGTGVGLSPRRRLWLREKSTSKGLRQASRTHPPAPPKRTRRMHTLATTILTLGTRAHSRSCTYVVIRFVCL